MKCLILTVYVALVLGMITQIQGHGMMLDPPGRSSRWRFDTTAPTNYNDNALWCGGFGVQWYNNGGKCGYCGDDYALPTPRPNELGGLYGGTGVITKTYTNSYTVQLGVQITVNHKGYIYFNLCNLDEFVVESDDCYNKYRLKFADGSDQYDVGSKTGLVEPIIVLPEGLSCKHCVLRWTYNAGNNWGTCEDGSGAMGCGAQEQFMACSDISIQAAGSKMLKSIGAIPVDADIPIEVEDMTK